MMDSRILPAILLLIGFASTDGQNVSINPIPRLLLNTIIYYDIFDDDVGMAYYNGYIQVECELGGPTRYECTLERVHLISPKGEIVWSAACNDRVTLRLDINENTTFGEYKCQYKTESSSEVLTYDYRFCAPEAVEAERDAIIERIYGCVGKLCVVNADGVDPCHKIEEKSCLANETGVTYCGPKHGSRGTTFCKASVKSDQTGPVSVVNGDNFCFHDLEDGSREASIHDTSLSSDPISYNGHFMVVTTLEYAIPHAMRSDRGFYFTIGAVKCPGCSYQEFGCKEIPHKASCSIARLNGEVIEERQTLDKCNDYFGAEYVFNHSVFIDDQFDVYKFKCVFENETAVVVRTQNYLVDFGMTKATVHQKKQPAGKQYPVLECQLSPYPPSPWQVEWRWFYNLTGSGSMIQIKSVNTSIFTSEYRSPVKYRCEALIWYQTRSRRPTTRKLETIVKSEEMTAAGVSTMPLRFAELVILVATAKSGMVLWS